MFNLSGLLGGLLGCVVVLGALPSQGRADGWPALVEAVYTVRLAGFDLGRFKWRSQINGDSYNLSGDGELSAAFGAWTWHGTTSATGHISPDYVPEPSAYKFDYRSAKSGSMRMAFADGGVAKVVVVPDVPPEPDIVPVHSQHLKSVLDPLSGVMAMSRTTGANPCLQTVSIFDGKQRFDLALTFVRMEQISESRPSGQPNIAYVCRVRYIPIAGYKKSSEVNQMASSQGIEVSLRPVPSAGLFVPYRITIPTLVGTAEIVSNSIALTTASNRQIALVR